MPLNLISRQWRRYHLGDFGSLIPGNFGITPAGAMTPGDAWAAQVVLNGGAQPSTQSIGAINTFWYSLTSSNIPAKMYQVNIIAPDSLTAALTPLTVGNTGSLFWVNHGIVSADVTIHGLATDGGSSKWAGTGVSGSIIPLENQGLTFINTDSNNNGLIAANNVNDTYSWGLRYTNAPNGNTFYETFFPVNRISVTVTDPMGFLSGNRSASNAAATYWGDNAHAVGVVAFTTAETGSIGPANVVGIGAAPTSTGTLTETAAGTMSFVAIHQGLSSAEVTTFSNAVKTLRNSLGGGWV